MHSHQPALTTDITDERMSLNPLVTQHIVYFILLELLHIKDQATQRISIYRLALTSKAWCELMLAPLNVKLNSRKNVSTSGKSTIEILRHRLFESAGLVTLRNDEVVSDNYEPSLANLIYFPNSDTSSIPDESSLTTETTEIIVTPRTEKRRSKLCYAVGIFTNHGLNKSFESDQYGTSKFKVFETRDEADVYVNAISDSVMGYSVSPRAVQPIMIQPRKLSSGGIDKTLSLQFFNVAEEELYSTTPPPPESESFLNNSRD